RLSGVAKAARSLRRKIVSERDRRRAHAHWTDRDAAADGRRPHKGRELLCSRNHRGARRRGSGGAAQGVLTSNSKSCGGRSMDNRVKDIVLLFSLFVASDFVLGYIRERSIPAGVISVVGGLFSTAFYFTSLLVGFEEKQGWFRLLTRISATADETYGTRKTSPSAKTPGPASCGFRRAQARS